MDLVLASLCALVIVAPFETGTPWFHLPGQAISNVETALAAVLAICGVSAFRNPERWNWESRLTMPLAVFVAVAFMTAATAPSDRVNALHMAARVGLMSLLVVVVSSAVRTLAHLRRIMLAATVAGTMVAVLVMLEYAGLVQFQSFHAAVSLVGGQLRASGPLQYPTIASMFLEICFALTLGLVIGLAVERSRTLMVSLVLSLVLMGEAIVLTFTRSGLIAVAIAIGLTAWGLWSRRQLGNAWPLVVVAATFVLETTGSRSAESLRARWTTEGQGSWYRAAFEAPPKLRLTTGSAAPVRVIVRNQGRVTWSSDTDHPFHLSYHWLSADGDTVISWEEARTRFEDPVPPGAAVELIAHVVAPDEPGSYRLAWDIEQTNRLWFSTEPDAVESFSIATVGGSPIAAADRVRRGGRLPARAYRPGRQELWASAVALWRPHALTGIGLDNFRLLSGSRNPRSDPRVHTNNMYLELLVGTGLLGAAALAWFGLRLFELLRRLFIAVPAGEAIGVAAATVAILVHGLVDAFLAFTPLYILIAVTLGLAVAAGRRTERDAYRV